MKDNGVATRPAELQTKVVQTLSSIGMKMGGFVAYASFDKPTFTRHDPDSTEEILSNTRNADDVAERVNTSYLTFVLDSVDQQHGDQERGEK